MEECLTILAVALGSFLGLFLGFKIIKNSKYANLFATLTGLTMIATIVIFTAWMNQ